MTKEFIEQVLSDEFFNKYSRNDENNEPLKEQVFEELKEKYGYPENEVDKDDLLYLVQRLSNE